MSKVDKRGIFADLLGKRSILVSVLVAFCLLASLASSALAASGEVLVLHFDEGSGTVARDSSGYGNDGTIHDATWVDGITGKALRFDGSSDYVGVPLKESFTADLTIEFWMKNTVKRTYQQRIVDLGSYSSTGFQLCEWIDGVIIIDNSGGPAGNVRTQSPYNDGFWHHVVGVRQGNEYRLYVDGAYVGSIAGTVPVYNYVFIGRRAFIGDGCFFDGIVEEVRIYNRALSADEIKAQYLALAPPTPTPVPTPTPAPTPYKPDSDGDGWSDEKEEAMGTNPYSVDSDKDGLNDPQDPNPTVPEKEQGMPGFEAVLAIAGLLAVAYFGRRRRR